MFLSYLSKDPFVMNQILERAREIYQDRALCDLEEDVDFLSHLSDAKPEVIFDESDFPEPKQRLLKSQDKEELKGKSSKKLPDQGQKEEQDFLKIKTAYRTTEILGTFVRNFAGSLTASEKYECTEECYYLGLRTLKYFISLFEDNIGDIKRCLAIFFGNENGTSNNKRAEGINEFIYWSVQFIVCNFLEKISNSLGSEELRETYEKVNDQHDLSSINLINHAIKLDHFRNIVWKEVIRFYEEKKDNDFLTTTLKILVVYHFYRYYVDRDIRKRLCDKLGIPRKILTNEMVLGDKLKKFPKPS